MNAVAGGPGAAAEEPEELKLSPSETMAHNSAMRISGARRGGQSTQKALASIVLGFELIVVFLMGMTVYGLALLEPPQLGIFGGIGLCVVIIVGLGLIRVGRVGIWIGWAVHVLMFLSGFVLPMGLIVSVLFTALWIYCMWKGAQLDRQRVAYLRENGL